MDKCFKYNYEFKKDEKYCPNCGKARKSNINEYGNNFPLAIASIVCIMISLNILGLVFAIISYNSNKDLNNDAKLMSKISIIINAVFLGIKVIVLLFIAILLITAIQLKI